MVHACERKLCLWLTLLTGVLVGGCANGSDNLSPVGLAREHIVFGVDDREETHLQGGVTVPAELAQASVALVPASRLELSDPSVPRLVAQTLRERFGVCPDERFAAQPAAADCSGTLVTPDTVLTAGHCLSSSSCARTRFVFDYAIAGDGELKALAAEDVYSCAEVVVHLEDGVHDYAMVRLDRSVVGRVPVRVQVGALPLAAGSALLTIGHPSGLPQKISANATVNDPRPDTLDYFTAHLDSLPGNSGGGVFLNDSGKLAGVLVRGPGRGYVRNTGENCVRAEQVSDDSSLQVDSVYVAAAVADYCSVATDPILCACGNGLCEPQRDENTASCSDDCGSRCGDGACNGTETGDNCYSDCGRCGNSVCESHEVSRLSCCEDCGCPSGFSCDKLSCQPELGNLNGDATIDQRDVAALRTELLGLHPLPLHSASSDVDCSGSTDWTDLSALKRVADGSDPKLPCVRVESLALGRSHSCVVMGSGAVRCWGSSDFGRLGYGPNYVNRLGARDAPDVSIGGRAVQVAVSQTHSCVLSDTGKVKCWGMGSFGQLGYGNTSIVGLDDVPSDVGWVELSGRAIRIATGGMFSCAILDDGRIQCWGDNSMGQLGYGHRMNVGDDEVPAGQGAVSFGERAVELALGDLHACVRLASGAVHCWGTNFMGQLGSASFADIGDDEPASAGIAVALGAPAKAIAVGSVHSCALLTTGDLRCWGDNSMGQLGRFDPLPIGDDEAPNSVAPVPLATGVSGVVAGESTTCVRYDSGDVSCWGANSYGELGLGTVGLVSFDLLPSQLPHVSVGSPVVELFAGPMQTCAELRSGDLRCWGVNDVGQLGYKHLNNIGDDESPLAAGNLPLTGVNDAGWSFVNDRLLSVQLKDESTNGIGTRMTLYVAGAGDATGSGLTALLPFDTSESPDQVVELAAPGAYQGHLQLERESNKNLYSLRIELGGGVAQGRQESCHMRQGRSFRLGYADVGSVWRPENDYFVSDLRCHALKYATQRVQIIDDLGNVVYGWRRDGHAR